MMSKQKMREILVDAKRRIEEEGWVQGHYFVDAPDLYGYCALGSVAASIDEKYLHELSKSLPPVGNPPCRQQYYEITTFLAKFMPRDDYGHCSVHAWNDEYGRTKAEVVDLFERVITHLDEQLAPAQERELVLA